MLLHFGYYLSSVKPEKGKISLYLDRHAGTIVSGGGFLLLFGHEV